MAKKQKKSNQADPGDENVVKVKKKVSTKKSAVKKTVKKVVKKVLDSTELDEKIIAEYKENKTVVDSLLCYVNCYGAYVLAVGAGCLFGVNNWLGLGLLCITTGWAYWNICSCKPCKGGSCACGNNTCKK
tara:strand:+ start:1530 stop:1919 length:390 start_codon:yes stop_codon:yes gene_type:complete